MSGGSPTHVPSSTQGLNPSNRAVSVRGRSQIPRPSGSLIVSSTRRGIVRRTQDVNPQLIPASGSLFQSARNIEIQGGQFSTARGHQTNLTINLNHTALNDVDELPPTLNLPASTHSIQPSESDAVSFQPRDPAPREHVWTRRTSLPVQRSCDIYYRQLAVKGRGSPLWIPEPNDRLPIEYRRKGICVGDVGIITDYGGFDFMFNICLPHNHPINPRNLPEGFVPLYPPLESTDIRGYTEFKTNSYLASTSVERSLTGRDGNLSSLSFKTSASEGAVVTMPQGAYSEKLGNVTIFKNYLSVHAESWYKYVNGVRGREAKNGDVRLAIGCDKSTTWGMATFSNLTEHDALRLKFKEIRESSLGRTYGWEYSGMAEVRAGPDPQEVEELRMYEETERGVVYKNQCLFVETLNATLNDDIWNKLSSESGLLSVQENANASSSNLTPSSPGVPAVRQSDSFGGYRSSTSQRDSSNPGPTQTRPNVQFEEVVTSLRVHPSDVINNFLLKKKPGAKIAITEDVNWISVITEADHSLPPSEELFSRIIKTHDLSEENGVVSLKLKTAKFPLAAVTAVPNDILSRTNQDSQQNFPLVAVAGAPYDILSSTNQDPLQNFPLVPVAAAPNDILSWTNQDCRESVLFNSWGVLYRFQSTVAQKGQTVTTMWRTLRPNKEDRVAKLEWSANGGLGRVVMGKNVLRMADLARPDEAICGARYFTGPDDLQYRWRPSTTTVDVVLQDPNGEIIAFFRPTRQVRYQIGDVYGELHYIRNAGMGTVMHPPTMDMVTLTAMLYRFCTTWNL